MSQRNTRNPLKHYAKFMTNEGSNLVDVSLVDKVLDWINLTKTRHAKDASIS